MCAETTMAVMSNLSGAGHMYRELLGRQLNGTVWTIVSQNVLNSGAAEVSDCNARTCAVRERQTRTG